jgi:hypothetical protein
MKCGDNSGDGLDTPPTEMRFGQNARPTVEELDHLDTGIDLALQILDHRSREQIHE